MGDKIKVTSKDERGEERKRQEKVGTEIMFQFK